MNKRTILVVDDSATTRNILKKEFIDAGYEVLTAENGMVALSMLAWMKKKPDLITLDIDMPKMNGFEVCRKLREEYDVRKNSENQPVPIPIIFISANDSLENRRAGFHLEVIDFVTKPFQPGTITKIVNKILNPKQQFTGLHVLVVDDSSSIRRIISQILRRLGTRVTEAENGLQALSIIEERTDSFDLIITDYMMPEMRGDEFCRLIRQKDRENNIPIIIVSAFDDKNLIINFFNSGATDYLNKPFIEEELYARLQSHLQVHAYSRQLEELNQKLRFLAERDDLTGAFNRRFFQKHLQNSFAHAVSTRQDLCCLFFDLDYFKQVNDQCGHAFGDFILSEFASLVDNSLQKEAILARYGGEEFVALLPEIYFQKACRIAEDIRLLVQEHIFSQNDISKQITTSIGVSSLIAHKPKNGEELLSMADQAMYKAKTNGRNRVCS
ncbi:MAG TPA: response regulator [Desulfobulbus sp.]|nr:response regulator [Desulfobulbus sp.]